MAELGAWFGAKAGECGPDTRRRRGLAEWAAWTDAGAGSSTRGAGGLESARQGLPPNGEVSGPMVNRARWSRVSWQSMVRVRLDRHVSMYVVLQHILPCPPHLSVVSLLPRHLGLLQRAGPEPRANGGTGVRGLGLVLANRARATRTHAGLGLGLGLGSRDGISGVARGLRLGRSRGSTGKFGKLAGTWSIQREAPGIGGCAGL